MGKHTNGRIYAAAPLVPGQDDDLIGWLTSVPEGKRAQEVKKLLRLALFGAPPTPTAAADAALLAEVRQEQQRTVKWMEEWIAFFQAEIQRVGITQHDGAAAVEAVPQMSEDDAARLASKMKKASW